MCNEGYQYKPAAATRKDIGFAPPRPIWPALSGHARGRAPVVPAGAERLLSESQASRVGWDNARLRRQSRSSSSTRSGRGVAARTGEAALSAP